MEAKLVSATTNCQNHKGAFVHNLHICKLQAESRTGFRNIVQGQAGLTGKCLSVHSLSAGSKLLSDIQLATVPAEIAYAPSSFVASFAASLSACSSALSAASSSSSSCGKGAKLGPCDFLFSYFKSLTASS